MKLTQYAVRVYNDVTGEVMEMHTFTPAVFDRIARLLKARFKSWYPWLPDTALRVETEEIGEI